MKNSESSLTPRLFELIHLAFNPFNLQIPLLPSDLFSVLCLQAAALSRAGSTVSSAEALRGFVVIKLKDGDRSLPTAPPANFHCTRT
jgi:hypothetical protein